MELDSMEISKTPHFLHLMTIPHSIKSPSVKILSSEFYFNTILRTLTICNTYTTPHCFGPIYTAKIRVIRKNQLNR